MIRKGVCKRCHGSGQLGFIFTSTCMECLGLGYKLPSSRPPSPPPQGPPPREMPDIWQAFLETAKPTVNQIRDMESKQKEFEEMEFETEVKVMGKMISGSISGQKFYLLPKKPITAFTVETLGEYIEELQQVHQKMLGRLNEEDRQ